MAVKYFGNRRLLRITCAIAIIAAALAAPAVSAQPKVSVAELEEMKKSLEAQNIICAIGTGVSNNEQIARNISGDKGREQIADFIIKTKDIGSEGRSRSTGVIISGAEVRETVTHYDKETGMYTVYSLLALNPGKPGAIAMTFADPRDGKVYRTVKISGRTWMAENLNFTINNSWCYNETDSNCVRYGRLYIWPAAMNACPAGWRLPTRQDWDDLILAAGGSTSVRKLTSKTVRNGTDDYGFSALPGGYRGSGGFRDAVQRGSGGFRDLGRSGTWWSATEGEDVKAWSRHMYLGIDEVVYEGMNHKGFAFSVRCIRNRD